MGKKSKRRKADKEARVADKEADTEARALALENRAKRNRALLIGIPVVTAALAAIAYVLTDDRRIAALVAGGGFAFLVPVLLGVISQDVPPRDSSRAGSIDFGRKD